MQSGSAVDIFYNLGILTPNLGCPMYFSNKWDLLDSNVENMFIVIIPLHDIVHKARKYTRFYDFIAPQSVSTSNLTHASIIVLNDLNNYVLIEYGAYDQNREGDYESNVHYYEGKNGLRFVQLMKTDFEKILKAEQVYTVECSVKNKIQIVELLEGTKNIGFDSHNWTKTNYNLLGQNCQCFVSKAILVLKATRKNEKDRNHTESKSHLPSRILNVLEINEGKADKKLDLKSIKEEAYKKYDEIKKTLFKNIKPNNDQPALAIQNSEDAGLDAI